MAFYNTIYCQEFIEQLSSYRCNQTAVSKCNCVSWHVISRITDVHSKLSMAANIQISLCSLPSSTAFIQIFQISDWSEVFATMCYYPSSSINIGPMLPGKRNLALLYFYMLHIHAHIVLPLCRAQCLKTCTKRFDKEQS